MKANFDNDNNFIDSHTAEEDNNYFCDVVNKLPSTNGGKFVFQVEERRPILKGDRISVHTLLNQCAFHNITGYSNQKNLIQSVRVLQ